MKERSRRQSGGSLPALTILILGASTASHVHADPLTDSVQRFDISAQSTSDALNAFSKQSGLRLLFSYAAVVGRQADAINGSYTAEQVLEKLLAGTGLHYEVTADSVVVIREPKAKEIPAQTGAFRRLSDTSLRLAQADTSTRANSSSDSFRMSDSMNLEEIVVTAQKREERLHEVPQSVSVLSSEDLDRRGAVQFRDFAASVPGLSFSTQGVGYTQITLRGVTAGLDLGPTVGIYVDEVPYGSSSSLTFSGRLPLDVGLFDLDRIEVLRGPQGTLYGASSMGGLIKYVTKQPDADRMGVDVRAGMSGTRDGGVSYNGAATVNAPIVDGKVAMRASGFYSHDGGFIDNRALNQNDIDRSHVTGGRLDLLFTPSDALSVRITGFFQDIARDGVALADYTFEGTPIDGPHDQQRLISEPFDQRFSLGSATVTYDLGPAMLTSISAYQSGRSDFSNDSSGFFLPYYPDTSAWGLLTHQKTDRFTQELRLLSKRGRPLEWVIGGFYSDEKTDVRQAYILFDLAGQPAPNTIYDATSPTTVEETAAFGDVTWYVTDKLDVTTGMRYARNRGTFESYGPYVVARELTRSSQSVSTYLANARYRFNDSMTGYLRYATGYRPGGPNFIVIDQATGLPAGPDSFGADELSSYEAGFKAELADRRVSIDVSAYHIDWKDIQVITNIGNAFYRTNAPGGADVQGGELSVTARPSRDLTLTGTFAYTDAKLSDADPSLGAADGERLPNVPRFTGALNADFMIAPDGWQPTVGATVRHVSDRTPAFSSTYRMPEYTSVDLRAGFVLSSFSVQMYVHNLFDERGQTSAYVGSVIPGQTSLAFLQPRTIGISTTASF